MTSKTPRRPAVLTAAELSTFRTEGFLRLRNAFPAEVALQIQDAIWDELRDHGIERADRSTWRRPPRSPARAKLDPLNDQVASERFVGAISDCLGDDDWRRPPHWGGFLVTFPDTPAGQWDIPTGTWHWDGPPAGRGLLIFSFYSSVGPGGGGTLLLRGSHRLVADYYASLSADQRARPHKTHRKRFFSTFDPYLAELQGTSAHPVADRVSAFRSRATTVRGVETQVVELIGEPGEAVFCNLGMVHAVALNAAAVPRFMRAKFLLLDETAKLA